MTPLIVIQARLGSKRLPAKVLLPLGPEGKPVLQHVVERCQRSGYPVVVACPVEDAGPILKATYPFTADIVSFATPNEDVLGRYHLTALQYAPDIVVRITADCPLVDPRLIRAAVKAVEAGADYAGNTVERHWPRGLDVEAFHVKLLQKAHAEATDPYDREHVTPWMQRWASNPYSLPKTAEDAIGLTNAYRWCLDTPDDYSWLQEAYRRFPDPTPSQLLTLPPRFD